MKRKLIFFRWCWIFILLTACGPLLPQQTITPTTSVPTYTPALQTPTILPTRTPSPTPFISSPKSFPLFPLETLRIAYIVDSNWILGDENNIVYLQNGSRPPIQVASGGEYSSPIFSDDGKKIIFFSGVHLVDYSNIHSVNADGSQKRALITDRLLPEPLYGKVTQEFVYGTNQLLLSKYFCKPRIDYHFSLCSIVLSLVDTDTGETKELLHPSQVEQFGLFGNFKLSPDGKMLVVLVSGHIDIFNIDGKIIRHNVLSYTPSTPDEIFPYVHWLPDSSGLIVALPINSHHDWEYSGEILPTYAVWHYEVNGNVAVQLPLDPPLSLDATAGPDIVHMSPDGTWFLYNLGSKEGYSLYIGKLEDGHAQWYAPGFYSLQAYWSTDNKHFIYKGNKPNEYFLAAVDKPPLLISGEFLGWIDASHYIYYENTPIYYTNDLNPSEVKRKILVGEFVGDTILTYETKVSLPTNFRWFTFIILDPKNTP